MSEQKYRNMLLLAGLDVKVNYALEGLYEYGTLMEGDSVYPLVEGKEGPFMMSNGAVKYYNHESGKIEEAKDVKSNKKTKSDDTFNEPKKGVNPFKDNKEDNKEDDGKNNKSNDENSDGDNKNKRKKDKKAEDKCDDKKSKKSNDEKGKRLEESKKTSQGIINNVDDNDAEEDKTGAKQRKMKKIICPAEVRKSIKKRIKELKNAIEIYDSKGYNDGSLKPNAIDILEKIQKQLDVGTQESYQHAQLTFQRQSNTITGMFPATLIRFLSNLESNHNSKFNGKRMKSD